MLKCLRKYLSKIISVYLHLFPVCTFVNNSRVKEMKEFLVNKDVLDVGCGDGNNMISASIFVNKIVGIDISKELIRNAKRNSKAKYLVGDGIALPFSDNNLILYFAGM